MANRNIGIDVLKVIACAGVVVQHFGGTTWGVSFAVPVFMLLALYLSSSVIENGDTNGLLKRIGRLYAPFFAWGLIYFVGMSIHERMFSPMILLQQMLIGVPACPPLYFIFLLVINTMLLYIVCRWRHLASFVLVGLVACCLATQYSGLNAGMLADLSLQARCALGRFAELLPAAICGYWLRTSKAKRLVGAGAWVVFITICVTGYRPRCVGFSYQGMYLLCGAVGMSSLAIELGSYFAESVSERIKVMLAYLAGLTAGIYYVHLLIGKILEAFVGKHRSFLEAMLIFFVSAVCVFVMKRMRRLAWMVS